LRPRERGRQARLDLPFTGFFGEQVKDAVDHNPAI
jgi:hypothetical protein